MGLFDIFKRNEPAPKVVIKREYAAAAVSRLFSDFIDSDRSADAELRPALKKLRTRSRDLARNNEYAKRYLELLKDNIVGDRGFNIQVKAEKTLGGLDQQGNDAVEKAFKKWGRRGNCTVDGRLSWLDVQKMVIEGLARDGEVFLIKHRGSDFHDSFALEFIEPDRIDEEKNGKAPSGNSIRMGIEFDGLRRPVNYYMLANHPGDYDFATQSLDKKHVIVPARKVIHIMNPLRAKQSRGEPWMAPAMSALKQLDGFRIAAVVNARVGASKMGFFTSTTGDGFPADEYDGSVPITEAEPGSFFQLPEGVSFTAWDPAFPNNEFDSFHKAVLKGIASALGVSYTALSNDLEATSYSSIRAGTLEEREHYKNLQRLMIDHCIRPIFEAWMASAMELNTFGLPLASYDKFADATEIRGRGWNWVDPLKESQAIINGLAAGILSLQDAATYYGKDAEELLSQIARDKQLMQQFGVNYAFEPYGAQKAPVPPEGYEDGNQ